MNQLESNLKLYYDWGFLNIGAWTDISGSTTGIYGGDFNVLRPVDDNLFTDGQVWEAAKKDWVWETGVNYTDETGGIHNPISPVAGVTVNGSAVASNEYYINYPLGRVVFNTARSTSDTVRANYSHRDIQVYKADDVPWLRELQFKARRRDDSHYNQFGSGEWSVGSHQRIQFPCVIIEAVPRATSRPYEIGNNALWIEQDVLFHVMAEDRATRNNIIDFLRYNNDKTIYLFDIDQVALNYPLDYRGEITGTLMYDQMVDNYKWKNCRMTNATVSEVESISPFIHEAKIRVTTEVVIGEI